MNSRDNSQDKDPIEFIVSNEFSNFVPSANANPFKGLTPAVAQPIKYRFTQTYQVFAGTRRDRALDESKLVYFLRIPAKTKQGLFSYLVGLPSHFVYSIIPSLALVAAGLGLLIGYGVLQFLEFANKSKAPTLIKLLTSPLWVPIGLAAIGLILTGAVAYLATKAILYPINWLVQKAIVPALSIIATVAVSPIVGLVHLGFMAKRFLGKLLAGENKNPKHTDAIDIIGTNSYVLDKSPRPSSRKKSKNDQPLVLPMPLDQENTTGYSDYSMYQPPRQDGNKITSNPSSTKRQQIL